MSLSNKELLDKSIEQLKAELLEYFFDSRLKGEEDRFMKTVDAYATEKAKELLPKEKKDFTERYKKFSESKEFKEAYDNRPLGDVMSFTESDYKQFEEPEQCGGVRCQVGHTCFEDCSVESSEPQEMVKQIGELRLYDRADGVKGHYCVGRLTKGGFNEYWTGYSFGGAGKLYETKDAAIKTLNALNSIKDTSAPVESQEELWKALIDMYDLTDASSYGYATLIKKLSQHFSITRLTP